MTTITVRTQAGLDNALAGGADTIIIDSPAGVSLKLGNSDSATVRAYGSATVRASGSATVRASDSATVWASGSATVEAYGSATVEASDSATVWAYDSATVRASGSATVRASDSATVWASKYVAVHLFSRKVTLAGGIVIDVTAMDLSDPQQWCDYHGVTVTDGIAHVYKAVDQHYRSHHGADYPPGSTPQADDWNAEPHCGNGLHFGATPTKALRSAVTSIAEPRFLVCGVRLDEMVCLGDKIKARRVVVPCVEVNRSGDPVGGVA